MDILLKTLQCLKRQHVRHIAPNSLRNSGLQNIHLHQQQISAQAVHPYPNFHWQNPV